MIFWSFCLTFLIFFLSNCGKKVDYRFEVQEVSSVDTSFTSLIVSSEGRDRKEALERARLQATLFAMEKYLKTSISRSKLMKFQKEIRKRFKDFITKETVLDETTSKDIYNLKVALLISRDNINDFLLKKGFIYPFNFEPPFEIMVALNPVVERCPQYVNDFLTQNAIDIFREAKVLPSSEAEIGDIDFIAKAFQSLVLGGAEKSILDMIKYIGAGADMVTIMYINCDANLFSLKMVEPITRYIIAQNDLDFSDFWSVQRSSSDRLTDVSFMNDVAYELIASSLYKTAPSLQAYWSGKIGRDFLIIIGHQGKLSHYSLTRILEKFPARVLASGQDIFLLHTNLKYRPEELSFILLGIFSEIGLKMDVQKLARKYIYILTR